MEARWHFKDDPGVGFSEEGGPPFRHGSSYERWDVQQVKMAGAMLVVVRTPQVLSREQESGCEFSGSGEKERGYRGGDWLVLEILERKSLKKARTGKRAAVGEFEVSLLLTLIHIHLISFSFRLDNILNLVDFMDYFLVVVVDLVVILMIWPGG